MSAPNSAYLNESFKEGTTDANAKQALIAIPDVPNATLKTRFYLDETLGKADGASGGTLVNHGFIGGCTVGSSNYYMHNIARHHTFRETINGQEVVLFNDAGLNTLGRVSNPLGDGNVQVLNDEIGTIELTARFRSAWHVDTNRQGFEWLTPGFANTTNNFGSQNQQVVEQKTRSLNDNDQHNQVAGATFQVRAWVENVEGKWVGDWITFTIQPRQMLLKYNTTYASSAFNGIDTRTIYVGTPALGVGTLFYKNSAMGESDGADQGYYTDSEFWYEVRFRDIGGITRSQVVATGPATASGWPTTDPEYDSGARVRQDAWFDASGFATPCNNEAQAYLPNRIIWKSTFNDVYYTQEVGGTIIANGWYVWGQVWHSIAGGMIDGTGSCPPPI